MKRNSKTLCLTLCLAMLVSLLSACKPPVPGVLTYEGGTLSSGEVGKEYSEKISFAEGANVITYALKTGDNLPDGLFLSNGNIVGTPTEKTNGTIIFVVIASADGFTSAEAEFKLTIAEGTLIYTGSRLRAAVAGEAYSVSVATAQGIGTISIAYGLKAGSNLPSWLSFNNGVLSGTPTAKTTTDITFTVVASAANYAVAEAIFSLAVIAAGELDYTGSALEADLGKAYAQSVAAANAGSKNPVITYTLISGDLPEGLSFNNGLITGIPTQETEGPISFTVSASADGYESKQAQFSIAIRFPLANYIFAAGLTDVDLVQGGGQSGAPAGKRIIIQGDDAKNAISGCFVGYTWRKDFRITFEIWSDRTTDGLLEVSLGGDIPGLYDWGPDVFEIAVNAKTIPYAPFELYRESSGKVIVFELNRIGEIGLVKGKNVITLTVLENEYYNGMTGGPAIDCIKITMRADLTWNPRTDNLINE